MKNQISHDSIHRVEPSAKFMAEQRIKTEVDEAAIVKSNENEREEKENSTAEVQDTDAPENDKEGSSEREQYRKKNSPEDQTDNEAAPNHFLGGQIFDSKA